MPISEQMQTFLNNFTNKKASEKDKQAALLGLIRLIDPAKTPNPEAQEEAKTFFSNNEGSIKTLISSLNDEKTSVDVKIHVAVLLGNLCMPTTLSEDNIKSATERGALIQQEGGLASLTHLLIALEKPENSFIQENYTQRVVLTLSHLTTRGIFNKKQDDATENEISNVIHRLTSLISAPPFEIHDSERTHRMRRHAAVSLLGLLGEEAHKRGDADAIARSVVHALLPMSTDEKAVTTALTLLLDLHQQHRINAVTHAAVYYDNHPDELARFIKYYEKDSEMLALLNDIQTHISRPTNEARPTEHTPLFEAIAASLTSLPGLLFSRGAATGGGSPKSIELTESKDANHKRLHH